MSVGATNKRKGADAERYYAKIFRDLGFEHCVTSRQASRLYDNAKIDLMYVPFNIQVKAGKQKGFNAGKELMSMKSCIASMFPPTELVHQKPCIAIHKKPASTNKRLEEDELVYMSEKQYKDFCNQTNELIELHSRKVSKALPEELEFRVIIAISFNTFVEKIVLPLYTIKDGDN
jgi:hypothetical protein